MANLLRGEVDVVLGAATYTMRPTFQAICELEAKIGCNLYQLALRFQEGQFTLQEITSIVWFGLRGVNTDLPFTYDALGNMIVQAGIVNFLKYASQFLASALGIELGNTS